MARIRKKGRGQAAPSSTIYYAGKRSDGTFDKFRDLPCELRLMVWTAAMTSRLVAVIPRPTTKPSTKNPDEAPNLDHHEISRARGFPALFAVNQEARHLALHHYTWRFTIYLAIYQQGVPGSRFSDNWSVKHLRARVIMSPDDTLGVFRCNPELENDVSISKFRVKVADEKRSPWKELKTTDAPGDQNWFKKVAILGDAVASNLDIVKALNSTLWDLDYILHKKSALTKTVSSPHTQRTMSIATADMAQVAPRTPVQPIARAFWDRFKLVNRTDLDIIAYKLTEGEQGEHWSRFLGMLSQSSIRNPNTYQYAVRRPPRW